LYDDSGDKIIQPTTAATTNRRLISPKTTFVPLGSPSRPISAAVSASTDNHPSVADGSLNRPIAIHDCADILDEREQDVLHNAARKQAGKSMLQSDHRTEKISSSSSNGHTVSKPPQCSGDKTVAMHDDVRDSDILQKATKRRQGLLEKKKMQHQRIVHENSNFSAIAANEPISSDMHLSKIETSRDEANDSVQHISPKQSKGILGFFRGSVSAEK
jgi:hypothetical protein